MEELSDRDLTKVRLRFIDLIKSFFSEEPDAETMGRWRGTFSALHHEQVNPSFDSAVRQLNGLLARKSLKELREEYYQLFVNPFDGQLIETTVSYYLDGRSYGPALAKVRGFMVEAGVRKNAAVTAPEDALVVLLDTFASLVELEKAPDEEDRARSLQVKILKNFIDPLSAKFEAALDHCDKADFYRLCAKLLTGYLELEKGLVGAI
jgi:TorA maturation chaperone TorD